VDKARRARLFQTSYGRLHGLSAGGGFFLGVRFRIAAADRVG
jgi:hypothetical protein